MSHASVLLSWQLPTVPQQYRLWEFAPDAGIPARPFTVINAVPYGAYTYTNRMVSP